MEILSRYLLNEQFALIISDWKRYEIDYVIVPLKGGNSLDTQWVDVYVPTAQYEQALRIAINIESGLMA